MRDDAPVRRNLKDAFDASAAAAAQVAAGPQAAVPQGGAAFHGPVGHLAVGLPVQAAPVGVAVAAGGHPGLPAPVWPVGSAAAVAVNPPGPAASVGGTSAVGHPAPVAHVGNDARAPLQYSATIGGASAAVDNGEHPAIVYAGVDAAEHVQFSTTVDPFRCFAAPVDAGVVDPTRPTRKITRWRGWQRSPEVVVSPAKWVGWDVHLPDVGLPLDFAEGYVGVFGGAEAGETGSDGVDGYPSYSQFQQGFESLRSGYSFGDAGGNMAHDGDGATISSSQTGETARASLGAENGEAGVLTTPQFPTDTSAAGVIHDSFLPRSSNPQTSVEGALNSTAAAARMTFVLEVSEDCKTDRANVTAVKARSGLVAADESGISPDPKAAPIDVGFVSDTEGGTEPWAAPLPLVAEGAAFVDAADAVVGHEIVPNAENGEEGNGRPAALAMAGALVPYRPLVGPGRQRAVAVPARIRGGRIMKLRSSYKYVSISCGFAIFRGFMFRYVRYGSIYFAMLRQQHTS